MQPKRRIPHHYVGSSFIPRCSIAAFCHTDAALSTMSKVFESEATARAQKELINGSVKEVANKYAAGETPDLLIIEFSGSIEDLDPIAEICSEETRVIIIGAENDVVLYRRLLSKGIEEYLFHPLTVEIVISSLMRSFAGERPFNSAKLISVAGVGGGMGTSTVAQSIAYLLSENVESRVLLIDLDLYLGTSTLNFDFVPVKGLHDLLQFQGTLTVTDVELIMSEQRPRLNVLASEPSLSMTSTVNADVLMKLLDIASLTVDYVVLDLPSGWGELQKEIVLQSDFACLVTDSSLLAYRNAGIIKAFLDKNYSGIFPPRLILNRHDPKVRPDVSLKTFQKAFGVSNFHTIPDLSDLFSRAYAQTKLPIEVSGSKKLRSSLSDLVERLEGNSPDRGLKGVGSLLRLGRRGGK